MTETAITPDNGEAPPVRLLWVDEDARYDPEDFEVILPTEEDLHAAAAALGARIEVGVLVVNPAAQPPLAKLEALREVDKKFDQSYRRQRKVPGDLADQSASTYDQSLASLTALAGWSDQEICDLLVYSRVKHGDSLKTDRTPPEKYYTDTIRKAREFARQQRAGEIIEGLLEDTTANGTATADGDPPRSSPPTGDILTTLSSLFGFPIQRLVKYPAADPVYRLEAAEKSIVLGGVEALLEQRLFRRKVAALMDKIIPPFKGARWESISQAMLTICVVEELGEESTEPGSARAWLRDYFSERPPLADRDEAVAIRRAFLDDGKVGFFESDFRQWLLIRRNERISSKALGAILRTVRSEPRKTNLKLGGKWTTRYVWWVSWSEVNIIEVPAPPLSGEKN